MKCWLGVVALPEGNQSCCEMLTKHCPTQVMGWCQQFQGKKKKIRIGKTLDFHSS